jgi:WD40 repeat protein
MAQPFSLAGSPLSQVTLVPAQGRYLATAGLDGQLNVYDCRTYKRLHSYFTPSATTDLDISQRGLLSVAFGTHVEIWKDALSLKAKAPYMSHHTQVPSELQNLAETGEICFLYRAGCVDPTQLNTSIPTRGLQCRVQHSVRLRMCLDLGTQTGSRASSYLVQAKPTLTRWKRTRSRQSDSGARRRFTRCSTSSSPR